ncbi:MAG: sialidase family protein [Pseudoxanthomonas sp.]
MRAFLMPCLFIFAACGKAPPAVSHGDSPVATPRVTEWSLPVSAGAQPDLVAGKEGRLLLSWVEADGDRGHALKFAKFDGKSWDAPRLIVRGDDWFVNWADIPHIASTDDGALWAHWLQQSATAKYAYDVVLSRSSDGGATWSPPSTVNDDGTPTEHGFVSLWPASRDTLGIAWLDGRQMAGGGHGNLGHGNVEHGEGAMTLRTAVFDAGMEKSAETELDPRTCDCCQTSVAMTSRGLLLVYRDRDGGEIRDIVGARFEQGAWTLPRKVHDDRWQMPACPVNGPAVAARGNEAWVAWYTAAGDVPKVRLARSQDSGDSFSVPVELDSGPQVQGRVGVAIDGDSVWVNWTREDADGQSLWLARYRADRSTQLQRLRVVTLNGRGHATGIPEMVIRDGNAQLVWTDVVAGKPVLRGARVTLR